MQKSESKLILLVLLSLSFSAESIAAGLNLIRSDYQKGEITQLCKQAIDVTKEKLNQIAKIPAAERTVSSTLLAMENITTDFSDQVMPLTFMGYVSTKEEQRKAGSDCEEQVNQFNVEVITRQDLYDAVRELKPTSADEKRLLQETLKVFEMNGLKLSGKKRAQVKELKKKLAVAETQFGTRLNEDQTRIEVTEAELAGVPEDYKKELKKTADGLNYWVNTRSSDYTSFFETASNSEVRRKWWVAYLNRGGAENTRLLEEAIVIRQKIAKLMGFKTWVDYRANNRMAKNAKNIQEFLAGLEKKLSKRNQKDLSALLKLKRESEPNTKNLNQWDINYYARQLKKRDYSLDVDLVREYFPAEATVAGMFDVYSKILGVRFTQEKNAEVWSPDVQLYRIQNAADDRLIGYFYTDFVPRANKYGHAAAFPLIAARKTAAGYSQPVAAVVANFAPPQNGKPSLLSHDEVETLFHEFGHIMHQTLTRAPFASLAGSSVANDFVEAPSQMLENWVWSAEILNKISGHYLRPSEKLPEDLLKKMLAARDFNQGYLYTRQLVLGTADFKMHSTTGPVKVDAVFNQVYEKMMKIKPAEDTHFPQSFGHLMGGYDAGYYGYLWSEVYSQDMFTRFEKGGLLNAEIGSAYRRSILESGNMRDALDLVEEFLGRKSTPNAFFKRLGI
jgi:thimet oligopeptidase